jgi:hypothetical protein
MDELKIALRQYCTSSDQTLTNTITTVTSDHTVEKIETKTV